MARFDLAETIDGRIEFGKMARWQDGNHAGDAVSGHYPSTDNSRALALKQLHLLVIETTF